MKAKFIGFLALTVACCMCCDLGDQRGEDFRQAIDDGNVPKVEQMLREGADVNSLDEANRTAIYDAVMNDQPRIAELLIKHGARLDVKDVDGKTPVEYATDPAMKKLLGGASGK